MEKVTLPKEVAEAIKYYQSCEPTSWKHTILLVALQKNIMIGGEKVSQIIRDYANIGDNFSILLQALVNGFKVEETPEERVLKLFAESMYESTKRAQNDAMLSEWWESRRLAIIDTVNALGIKIEGVNA